MLLVPTNAGCYCLTVYVLSQVMLCPAKRFSMQ